MIPHFIKRGIRGHAFKKRNRSVFIGPYVEVDPATTRVGKNCTINFYTKICYFIFHASMVSVSNDCNDNIMFSIKFEIAEMLFSTY